MDISAEELKSIFEEDREPRWRDSLPAVLRGMRSVYRGYIGEKLSQDSPDEVWLALRKAGVTQLIDLRYHYNSEKFKARCQSFGINYFSYPIHNDPETIAIMVENYGRFTELLNGGDFYMQGRHTAYVALCIYWALSQSPGLYPCDLRREIKQDEQVMKRAVPLLFAMNKYSEERYGGEAWLSEGYYEQQREQIRDFIENDWPKKVSYSVIDFMRSYRNESVVYDVSVQGGDIVGYLYAPKREYDYWEYDIVLYPPVSDKARSFEEAQQGIARYLCRMLPHSIKWAALPDSVKTCIFVLQRMFD